MHGVEGLHPSARRVADALSALGVDGNAHEFEASTKTAADAARALGCELGAIASCLVFVVDDVATVIIKSGAFRVDTDDFVSQVGASSMRRADADEVRMATGQPIGGVSPAGWPAELPVYIDDSLAAHDVVWAALGTPNAVFSTSYEELRRITGAKAITLKRP